MKNIFAYGLKFAVFNFIIVGIWGALMRYKMAFPLPIFNQKNLLEAHSHFGFYGWIALAIYFLINNNVSNLQQISIHTLYTLDFGYEKIIIHRTGLIFQHIKSCPNY